MCAINRSKKDRELSSVPYCFFAFLVMEWRCIWSEGKATFPSFDQLLMRYNTTPLSEKFSPKWISPVLDFPSMWPWRSPQGCSCWDLQESWPTSRERPMLELQPMERGSYVAGGLGELHPWGPCGAVPEGCALLYIAILG